MSKTVESDQTVSAPVLAAYSYCETVTGQQARNFAYGIRLLPTSKRRAMSALYAFSRRVDDIGDGGLEPDIKAHRLDETRSLLARVQDGKVEEDDTDPVAVALADAASRFPIPLDGLDELIDGVLMDLRGETYETWDDLKVYCRCVAGAIGRVSLGVFGTEPGARGVERAPELADTLGLALQLTNILRDVREDAEDGRTYLPADDLAKFGCSAGFHGPVPPAGSDFAGLVHFEVRRARALFAEGYRLLPMLDRRSGACVAAMAGIYRRLLDRIERDPEAVLRGRVSLPGHEKAYVAVRGLSGLDTRTVVRGATRGTTRRRA
ncbi:presqualene diphosphate synthase HpnD [Streptomyces sp. NPDC002790]|uniref:presqualene diphosphate synthase HpnD n=1 Tax=Streptomyces sp. NPDC002790 TaxID=3154431 RepID=UPI00332C46C9